MTRVKQVVMTIFVGVVLAAGQTLNAAPSHSFNMPAEDLITGGQPSQAELAELKHAGITKVINLRGPNEEVSFNEKAEVERLGLEYVSLPIAGAADVTLEHAQKLHDLLRGNENVFLHCASGNRVGALLAIRAHEIEGKPAADALEFGRAAGLGSLEETVKSVLGQQEITPTQ